MADGFTQVPNWILDKMATMHPSTFQVVMCVCRKTIGYSNGNGGRKEWDRISLTQICDATGLSRQGTINAIADAVERGYIARRESGISFEYKVVNSVDQSTQYTSQLSVPEVVNSVDQSDPKLVNSVDTQKKGIKENKQRIDSTTNGHSASEDRDGRMLLELIRQRGFMYVDSQPNRTAMLLESDYTDGQLRAALDKTQEAHQKQIATGKRGITAPMAYMRQVLAGMNNAPPSAEDKNVVNINKLMENSYE